MTKYTCERCLKDFSQKSHYKKHMIKKRPCQDNKGKIEEVVEKIITDKLNINKKLILDTSENNEVITMDSPYEKNETYLAEYLSKIRKKDGKCKRVCMSPLRYAGGKSKAVGLIFEKFTKIKRKKNYSSILWWWFI